MFTTHSRAIFSDKLPHDQIIIDEDPIEELISVQALDLNDLQKLSHSKGRKLFEHSKDSVWDLMRFLVDGIAEGEITKLPPQYHIDMDEHAHSFATTDGISSNIVSFLNCDYLYKQEGNPHKIYFVNQSFLPEDKKIIILSATINVEAYRRMYGDRLEVIDITDIETKGTIRQHVKKSYSRSSLENSIEEINSKLDDDKPTLTFMTFANKLKNGVTELYYGNSEGYDEFKGQNIQVVGTPFKNQALYLLMGKCLGINVDKYNRKFEYQNVERWRGFRFAFNTFTNDELRDIHLANLESQLIQLIGRARALREDVQVDVYSSLPLRITDHFVYD